MLTLRERVAHPVLREVVKLRDRKRTTTIHNFSNEPATLDLMLHLHHIDDFTTSGAAYIDRGCEPPRFTIGANLYKHPVLRATWHVLNAIPFQRGQWQSGPAYREAAETIRNGRSVLISNGNGLSKHGRTQTDPAIIAMLYRQSGCTSLTNFFKEFPLRGIANNSAHLIGEELRALRDAKIPVPGFDRTVIRAYWTADQLATVQYFGEPIMQAATFEDAAKRVDETVQGKHPIFPEDIACYALAVEPLLPLAALPSEKRDRALAQQAFVTKIREQHGEAAYQSALTQRVEPVRAFLAWNAPSASRTREYDTLLGAVQQTP
jgi:hypothetical protein